MIAVLHGDVALSSGLCPISAKVGQGPHVTSANNESLCCRKGSRCRGCRTPSLGRCRKLSPHWAHPSKQPPFPGNHPLANRSNLSFLAPDRYAQNEEWRPLQRQAALMSISGSLRTESRLCYSLLPHRPNESVAHQLHERLLVFDDLAEPADVLVREVVEDRAA